MEVEYAMRSIYSGDPGVDIISFTSHLVIQQKFKLYLSYPLVSLALSEVSWIHAIAQILMAM
jgi:hypothetical protein